MPSRIAMTKPRQPRAEPQPKPGKHEWANPPQAGPSGAEIEAWIRTQDPDLGEVLGAWEYIAPETKSLIVSAARAALKIARGDFS